MKAQGLFEYALQLVSKTGGANLSRGVIAVMLDKAIKAQLKAYGLHDLPLYLFHLACIYRVGWQPRQSRDLVQEFLALSK